MLNSHHPAANPGSFALQLREKWREIPATRQDRQFSAEMLARPDAELLDYWEECRRLTCTPEVRGWYQEVYKHRFQGLEVADVGPGVGLDGIFFAEHGAHITFVDIVEDNLKLLERICRLKGIAADFYFVDDFFNFRFRRKFHVFLAVGSLINAPFDFTQQQVAAMTKFLRVGGKVAMLGYPRERYLHLGVKSGEQFGKRTDGERTPWCEWYDDDKIRALFGQDFHLEWSRNFGSDAIEFNWFELTKLRDAKTTRNTPLPSVWVRKAEIQVCSDPQTTAVVSGPNGSANGRIASANSAAADLLFNQPLEPISPTTKRVPTKFQSASDQAPALAEVSFARTSPNPTLVSAVPVADLHRQLGFKVPLDYPQSSHNKPLTQWRMEADDAPILRYIYREAQPRRHLEFGTWQGAGTVYCLEETKASVWTVNLPFGENPQAETGYGHYAEDLPALHAWAEKTGLPLKQSYRTDTLGFIGRLYLEKGLGHRVNQIYADSTKWDISNLPSEFFDTVLIDGAHTHEIVLSDTGKALQLLRPGGLLMWHDFCPPVYNQCPSTQGVFDALAAQWDWLEKHMSCLFWIYPSWILLGVKKKTAEEPFRETLHQVDERERTAQFKPAEMPASEPDFLLRQTLGRATNRPEPLSRQELGSARQSVAELLEARDLSGYLLQNRARLHPATLPLLLHDLADAERSGNALLAQKLQNIYWCIQLEADDKAPGQVSEKPESLVDSAWFAKHTAVAGREAQPAFPLHLFVHLPKTAGTTFLGSVVPQVFQKGEAFVLRGDAAQNRADLHLLNTLTPEKFNQLKFIGGHFADQLSNFQGREVRRITLLREPVERCLSGYFHAMYHESTTPKWESFRKEKLCFSGFVERYQADNFHSFERIFSPELKTEENCSQILRQFSLVGLTEKFPEFLFLLHSLHGWKLALFENRLVRKEKKGFFLSAEDRAAVRARDDLFWMFRREFELYERAAKQFEALWNREVEGHRLLEFETYKSFLARYQRVCTELAPNHDEARKISRQFETWLKDVSGSTPAPLLAEMSNL